MFKGLVDWFYSLFWKKELDICIIGLQNAGKTSLVNSMITGHFDSETKPTIGLNYKQFKKGGIDIKTYDLGGQTRFRSSWEKYCSTADVIIYIVDASDLNKMPESKKHLHELLAFESIKGIPLLVLGNKNDLNDCLNEEELIEHMELKAVANRKVCCYSVSAKNQNNIDITMKWLSNQEKRS